VEPDGNTNQMDVDSSISQRALEKRPEMDVRARLEVGVELFV